MTLPLANVFLAVAVAVLPVKEPVELSKTGCVVLHSVAPPDTALAGVANVTTRVAVSVAPDGSVTRAEAQTPRPPFVADLAEEAARQWVFGRSDDAQPRKYVITFDFGGRGMTDLPSYQLVTLEDPLHMRVLHLQSVISRRATVDYNRVCGVHHTVMTTAIVPIEYGLPSFPSSTREISKMRRMHHVSAREFPNARQFVRGGCTLGSERMAEVYVCRVCVAKRRGWLAAHPRFEKYE
jgi:hypothetical protein